MNSKSLVHVYVALFPFGIDDKKITPARAEEIENCANAEVKLQKFYAWKLLETALSRSFGLNIEELDLKRTENGKWECSACCFSLSHSGNAVAVAVSDGPVGVDIERLDKSRFTLSLAERIATEREMEEMGRKKDFARALNGLWTKKEAIFKLLGGRAFLPKAIETSDYSTVTELFRLDKSYLATVASKDAKTAEFYNITTAC